MESEMYWMEGTTISQENLKEFSRNHDEDGGSALDLY